MIDILARRTPPWLWPMRSCAAAVGRDLRDDMGGQEGVADPHLCPTAFEAEEEGHQNPSWVREGGNPLSSITVLVGH